jgi:hypothetical protein
MIFVFSYEVKYNRNIYKNMKFSRRNELIGCYSQVPSKN